MKRKLIFDSGIISGDTMREIIEIFPETKDAFKQRKSFDEYYYTDTIVSITIEKIEQLNDNFFKVEITKEEIILED